MTRTLNIYFVVAYFFIQLIATILDFYCDINVNLFHLLLRPRGITHYHCCFILLFFLLFYSRFRVNF